MKQGIGQRPHSRVAFSLVLVVGLLAGLWLTGTSGSATPAQSSPAVMDYQGLINVGGAPYHGIGYFKFAIVDAPANDGTINHWANDGTDSGEPVAAVALEVNRGLFNVLLGDSSLPGMTQPVDGAVFATDPTYLRVWFSQSGATGSFDALEPNQRIAAVAYALQAGYAENAPNADMVDGYHAAGTATASTLLALDGSAHLVVPRVVDSENGGYYLDPASTSIVNSLDVRTGLYNGDSTQLSVGDGLSIDSAGATGVEIRGASSGLWIVSPAQEGIEVLTAASDGIQVYSAGHHGLYVDGTGSGFDGVRVDSAAGDGVEVQDATNGLYAHRISEYGVYAAGDEGGGYFEDATSGTYAHIAYGDYGIMTNGTTSFVQQHPSDASHVIVYASPEGGEAGTYCRGSGQLQNGSAVIELPAHFRLVTEKEGLTVQVTPRDDCNGLYVSEASPERIIVKELREGRSDARFDYLVQGIRAGYQAFQVLRDAADLGPRQKD